MFYVIGCEFHFNLDFIYDDTDNTIQAVEFSYRDSGIYNPSNIIHNKNTSIAHYNKYVMMGKFIDNSNGLVHHKDLLVFSIKNNKDDIGFVKVQLVLSKVHPVLPHGTKMAEDYLRSYRRFNYPSDWFACIKLVNPITDSALFEITHSFLGKSLMLLPPDIIGQVLNYYYSKDFDNLSLSLGSVLDKDISKFSDNIKFVDFVRWL